MRRWTACFVLCVVIASGQSMSNPEEAKKLGNVSLGLSIAGIIVTVIVIIIIIAVVASY